MTHRTRPAAARTTLPSRQERLEGRRQAAEYRAYAERWYQALRLWSVHEVPLGSYASGSPSSGGMVVVGVGGYTSGRGGAYGASAARYLSTPAGEFTEGEVGDLITTMSRAETVEQQYLGKLLDKLRHERSATPASLLREDGRWHQHRERVARYAVAVLTLAVQLRDEAAEGPLRYAQAVLRGATPPTE